MKNYLVLAALASVASAHAIVVIDDFSTPYAFGFNGSPNTHVGVAAGPGIMAGERDVQLQILSNPLNQYTEIAIGSGLQVTSNGWGTLGRLKLQYDGISDETGNIGFGKVLTNAAGAPGALAGNDRIRLSWLGNDLNVAVAIELRQAGSILETANVMRPAGSGAGQMDVMLNPANMAMADSVTLVFSPDAAGDFALTKIESVPEPASMAALGLGLAAVIRRRARR